MSEQAEAISQRQKGTPFSNQERYLISLFGAESRRSGGDQRDRAQYLHVPVRGRAAGPQVIVMTGGGLSDEGLMICAAANVPVLSKPFLASEILSLIRGQFCHARAAAN